MTGTDRAIRWSTVAAVAAVALVAAFVSYRHALEVVRAHGESGALALAYPATIDGLIYAASMVLLDAARRGTRAHPLAWCGLALGIGATLAANVAAGLASGPVGALIGAWPAVALVLGYELLMLLIRSSAAETAPEIRHSVADLEAPAEAQIGNAVTDFETGAPAPDAPSVPAPESTVPALECVPGPPASLNGHGLAAADRYSAELAAGDVPSIRRIRAEMRVGQPRAAEIQRYLTRLTPAGMSIAAIRAELREQPGDIDTATTTQEGGS